MHGPPQPNTTQYHTHYYQCFIVCTAQLTAVRSRTTSSTITAHASSTRVSCASNALCHNYDPVSYHCVPLHEYHCCREVPEYTCAVISAISANPRTARRAHGTQAAAVSHHHTPNSHALHALPARPQPACCAPIRRVRPLCQRCNSSAQRARCGACQRHRAPNYNQHVACKKGPKLLIAPDAHTPLLAPRFR